MLNPIYTKSTDQGLSYNHGSRVMQEQNEENSGDYNHSNFFFRHKMYLLPFFKKSYYSSKKIQKSKFEDKKLQNRQEIHT